MKRLIQLSLLLLLISSATAQESQPQETTPEQPTKILRVYDWKDLAQQHQLSGGEVTSMDRMSVLKIENTNNAPLDANNLPLEVSLLKISDPSLIKKAYSLLCEVKYENVSENNRASDNFRESGSLKLVCRLPPAAIGGDGRTIESGRTPGGRSGNIRGTSNWRPCLFTVYRNSFEGLPAQLELNLNLPGSGTI